MTATSAHRIDFVQHAYDEKQVDLGEITMNYAEAGSPDSPALLLIPEQTGSWWSYEAAMGLLAERFHVFAIDLRGQGRSTWTPKRYSLDNFGNDLVRFLSLVVGRPAIVSGCSSGGVLAAWLSAYALPGQVRAVICEDAPLFSSETEPAVGHNIRQGAGPLFEMWSTYLGDQWEVGDWEGFMARVADSPFAVTTEMFPDPSRPPQFMLEYDPEWARAFVDGTASVNSPHDVMLAQAKTPVLLTQHLRSGDPQAGTFAGSVSDAQIAAARRLVESAGQRCDYQDHPTALHMMHLFDPERFAAVVVDWAATLD